MATAPPALIANEVTPSIDSTTSPVSVTRCRIDRPTGSSSAGRGPS